MASQTLTAAKINADGSIDADYTDGSGLSYGNRAALISEVTEIITPSLLKKLLLLRWYSLDTDLVNPGVINGTSIQFAMDLVLDPLTIGKV